VEKSYVFKAIPMPRNNGDIYYFWIIQVENEINVGWCKDGRELSETYERFKKKIGCYVRLKTERVVGINNEE
jgi:hypothetical protein